jgi:hypothetical protein
MDKNNEEVHEYQLRITYQNLIFIVQVVRLLRNQGNIKVAHLQGAFRLPAIQKRDFRPHQIAGRPKKMANEHNFDFFCINTG